MTIAVGFDLGTTYSAVARVNDLGKPEILPNREGENITPSVVFFDGEQPIVGTMAKRSVVAAPLDVVQFVKRSMGDPSWRFETRSGTSWRPEEVSALILKRLKEDAERQLGTEVTDAVITVPAYFDDAPRRATIDAGRIAGLNVLRVLNEPTAAALAHGVTTGQQGTLLVYDLGGGTFDVTVLRIADGEFRVLATHGDRNLGGFDFDNALMRLLNERFVAAGGPDLLADDIAEAMLRERTEIAKHSLTSTERTTVTLGADGFSATVPVTRAEFDDACSSLLSRTRDIAELVLQDAGVDWGQLDRVLLAGGSTRMPMVRTMLADLSGTTPDLSANPDETIAHGAAVQAHLIGQETSKPARVTVRSEAASTDQEARNDGPFEGVFVRDVTSHGLGIVLFYPDSDERYNRVIVPPNTSIPASGSTIIRTRHDQQAEIRGSITEGNEEDLSYVRILGEQILPLGRPYPRGTPIETFLNYTQNQTVSIEMRWLDSGKLIGQFELVNVRNMVHPDVAKASMRVRRITPD